MERGQKSGQNDDFICSNSRVEFYNCEERNQISDELQESSKIGLTLSFEQREVDYLLGKLKETHLTKVMLNVQNCSPTQAECFTCDIENDGNRMSLVLNKSSLSSEAPDIAS